MPVVEGTAATTESSKVNCSSGPLLEHFLCVYASRCQEYSIEMNPRVVQAAIAMQDAIERVEQELSATHTTLIGAEYTLNAVPLGVSGSNALIPALAYVPLVKINLSECYLGDAGIRTLADCLSTSSECGGIIRDIHLSGVGMTDASPLALFVTAAQQLRLLDVSCNRIGTQPQGLAVLCGAMQHHKLLREVNLSDNMISGCCALSVRAIAEWMVCAGHKDSLNRIDLRFNALGVTREVAATATSAAKVKYSIYCFHPFVDALLFNNTLEFLELYGNALDADVLDVVEAKLAVNRRTKEMFCRAHVSRCK